MDKAKIFFAEVILADLYNLSGYSILISSFSISKFLKQVISFKK